jgi:hypothetical protein
MKNVLSLSRKRVLFKQMHAHADNTLKTVEHVGTQTGICYEEESVNRSQVDIKCKTCD